MGSKSYRQVSRAALKTGNYWPWSELSVASDRSVPAAHVGQIQFRPVKRHLQRSVRDIGPAAGQKRLSSSYLAETVSSHSER